MSSESPDLLPPTQEPRGLVDRLILFCLKRKLVVVLLVLGTVFWGLMVAPFDWDIAGLPRDPVAVDAIPDIGENQQIVFTRWMGRSPQDVEDQVTYPLTVSLLGIPGVKTIRSNSMFGFSAVYVIFEDDVDFYWSRARVLEKLNSLPAGSLPDGVQPALGPDATALGQVFWYTLEGRDEEGNPTGGWDLHELRTIQDWYVRYSLLAAPGISEVASVGGFVKEYQVDVDPDAMRAWGVSLRDIYDAIRMSNVDVGARTIEINSVEYVIRGLGFIESVSDIENTVIKSPGNVPVYVKNVAHVTLGPALRRGALDKGGAEVVGGVVVVRYGENPLAAIKNVKAKIEEIAPGLPKKTLPDGRVSQVTIVPFYDRTGLINETLGTLKTALTEEVLVTIIVVLVMVMHLRSSALVSSMLPLAILMCFIAMKLFGVDANIVALSGIAIAIGTIVDMGIIMSENVLRHLGEASPEENRLAVVYRASTEVGGAVLTAVATTVVGFLPVFTMQSAEGKLFRPLAFTKTFALISSIIIALTVIPAAGHILLAGRVRRRWLAAAGSVGVVAAGVGLLWFVPWWGAVPVVLVGLYNLVSRHLPEGVGKWTRRFGTAVIVAVVLWLLATHWLPLGPERGRLRNFLFVAGLIGGLLGFLQLFILGYPTLLRWALAAKYIFLLIPLALVLMGAYVWKGPKLMLIVLAVAAAVAVLFILVTLVYRLGSRALGQAGPGWRVRQDVGLGLVLFLVLGLGILAAGAGVRLGPIRQAHLGVFATQEDIDVLVEAELLEKREDVRLWTNAALDLKRSAFRAKLAELDIANRPDVVEDWQWSKQYRELRTAKWEVVRGGSLLRRLKWTIARDWEGRGEEFMPPLDEGSFLLMPTTMPHASIGEALDVLRKQDMGIHAIPETELVVGKIGRAETPLDPAPISMIETVINYKAEFLVDEHGHRLRFAYDPDETDLFRSPDGEPLPGPDGQPYVVRGKFRRDAEGELIPDPRGMPFRLWRPALDPELNEGREAWPGVESPDDIWQLILDAADIPGTTSAPRLQPIKARIVMLQSGMRAPMGLKIKGPDLQTIERVGIEIERLLKEVPSIDPTSVIADRIVGKPYLEIDIDRKAIARYGIKVGQVQDVIEVAVGGRPVTTTVEGRERYPVRVRYMRELRDNIKALEQVLVAAPGGAQIPLTQLAEINYVRGPQSIKTEDTFLVGYVLFDMKPGYAEVDVVEDAQQYLLQKRASGELELPPNVTYRFAGNYRNQVRAQKRLAIVLPLALFIIFLILYFQFERVSTTLLVFSGILVAWSGGFVMLWLYAQPWFLDFDVFGVSMQSLFQIQPINLSVAIWVGFLALFGIASDDGVVMATYLDQSFERRRPQSIEEIRGATIAAAKRRLRPCMMTTATTVLALIPVLTSRGRGSDIMRPMAIPSFGGMLFEVVTLLTVPVLYCLVQEMRFKAGAEVRGSERGEGEAPSSPDSSHFAAGTPAQDNGSV